MVMAPGALCQSCFPSLARMASMLPVGAEVVFAKVSRLVKSTPLLKSSGVAGPVVGALQTGVPSLARNATSCPGGGPSVGVPRLLALTKLAKIPVWPEPRNGVAVALGCALVLPHAASVSARMTTRTRNHGELGDRRLPGAARRTVGDCMGTSLFSDSKHNP